MSDYNEMLEMAFRRKKMIKVKIQLTQTTHTMKELEKINAVAAHAEAALNSIQFREFCLHYSWPLSIYVSGSLWWKRYRTELQHAFRWNYTTNQDGIRGRDLTNAQVYASIMNGEETLDGMIDGEADITVEVSENEARGVIGHTYPQTKIQWVAGWFFRSATVEELAGNVVHEWTHKLGFDHEYRRGALRQYTVPYAVGDFVANFKA